MPQQAITADEEPRAMIKGRWWTAPKLVQGYLTTALKQSTLSVKKSNIRSFIQYMELLDSPFANEKIPYRFVLDFVKKKKDTSLAGLPIYFLQNRYKIAFSER